MNARSSPNPSAHPDQLQSNNRPGIQHRAPQLDKDRFGVGRIRLQVEHVSISIDSPSITTSAYVYIYVCIHLYIYIYIKYA